MLQRQQEILDIIERLIKIYEDLLGKDAQTVLKFFQENRVIELIEEVEEYYKESEFQKLYSNAMAEIVSVKASAVRVMALAQSDELNMCKKLEFELLPLTENLRLSFYYYNWIRDDSEKKKNFFENEVSYYYRNRYLEEAKRIGKYKYELSIFVPAFNKLEVTKQCIKSLKKNLPKNISYELIFLNNGSSDETKEYFENQKPDKQLDIEVNGGIGYGYLRIMEGRYWLAISNDILVTENAIKNMYHCIESDRRIGWLVPTTPNISNLQDIGANYKSLDEMYFFARKNNKLNSDRWEERERLCNPVTLMRIEDWFDLLSKEYLEWAGESFPDDRISYVFRRKGYKSILAKDAYCYHFGSVTHRIEDSKKANTKYCKGRIKFIKQFGMDPWGYGIAYDTVLMNNLRIEEATQGNILGINSGIGGNPLKIKNLLKENTSIKNAQITYVTQYEMNWEDVKGLGNKAYKVQNWTECKKVLREQYDYILLENGLENNNVCCIKDLKTHLSEVGRILVRVETEELRILIEKAYNARKLAQNGTSVWLEIIK